MSDLMERDSEPDLAVLDEAEEARLAALLRHAFAPGEIESARHERLLLAALEDPFAEPSAEELVESARLREALEGRGEHQDARLARALSAAFSPRLDAPLSEPALAQSRKRKASGSVIFYRFAALTTALAVAAAVLLRVTPKAQERAAPSMDLAILELAQSRSTAAFFQNDAGSAPSERIDRIASVRSRELRDNRYALWGVR